MSDESRNSGVTINIPSIKWGELFNKLVWLVLSGALLWGWNVQGRLSKIEAQQDIVKRVENLEDMLVPIIVEYRIQEALRDRGINPLIDPIPIVGPIPIPDFIADDGTVESEDYDDPEVNEQLDELKDFYNDNYDASINYEAIQQMVVDEIDDWSK